MDYGRQMGLTAIAERIATNMLLALKAGQLPKINIMLIRAAIKLDAECPKEEAEKNFLEEAILRKIVVKVG